MPEETAGQATEQGTQTTTATDINIEEITKKVTAEVEAKYKNEISGLNRKVTESEKAYKLRLSEEERTKAEADEKRKLYLERYVKLAVKAAGFDESFSELFSGVDEEDIDKRVSSFDKLKQTIEKPHLDKIKSLEEEIKILKANGTPPKNGAGSNGKVISIEQWEKMDHLQQRDFMNAGGSIQ